jgi:hypothetical protein
MKLRLKSELQRKSELRRKSELQRKSELRSGSDWTTSEVLHKSEHFGAKVQFEKDSLKKVEKT